MGQRRLGGQLGKPEYGDWRRDRATRGLASVLYSNSDSQLGNNKEASVAKIAMIGAGSVVFAKRLLATDMLSWPDAAEQQITLMDIHRRLDLSTRRGTRLVPQEKLPARIEATLDRRQALAGADYVIVIIQVGGLGCTSPTWRSRAATASTRRSATASGPGALPGLRTSPSSRHLPRYG